jgi:hypothetical protein
MLSDLSNTAYAISSSAGSIGIRAVVTLDGFQAVARVSRRRNPHARAAQRLIFTLRVCFLKSEKSRSKVLFCSPKTSTMTRGSGSSGRRPRTNALASTHWNPTHR